MSKPLALITGGASGIGLAFACRWIREGGRAALLDLRPDAVTSAVEQLGGPDVAVGRAADVSESASVEKAVQQIADSTGGAIDAVVNCAGIARPAMAASSTDSEWSGLVDIHLNGTMRVNRAAYPFLLESKRAAIVNLSSVAATSGMPGRSSYCAAKAGVEGLTKALAVEWAGDKIRVNAVAPGYVNSAMTAGLVAAGSLRLEPVLTRTPMSRLAEPEEISAAIFFLASQESSYITGQTLYVDGGMTVDGNWY
ncbi:SDR family oxidoreductase [Pseudarthrobacter sp. R1]|uniref:SDR family NAD(P)-dependent oxidoreductase n=1 Tax=Pseudarthrobacter sp. R1 TaxID=2944934 RepID=UPI0021087D85|nr:SDR family NAD(P)-dependent oxidoreductase [Pseudarthrobacter sp. R1]MCQ6272311.1 SDR family oxidoreductase [Pseudarthrobacter sp. R1]